LGDAVVGLCLHAPGLFVHEGQDGVKFVIDITICLWMCTVEEMVVLEADCDGCEGWRRGGTGSRYMVVILLDDEVELWFVEELEDEEFKIMGSGKE